MTTTTTITIRFDYNPLRPAENMPRDDQRDVLILGDSIVKHVEPSNVKVDVGSRVDVVNERGARIGRIWSKLVAIAHSRDAPGSLILHVGSNLIPDFQPSYVADEIVRLLAAAQDLLPNTQISFSAILPKVGDYYLPGINEINIRVEDFYVTH